MRHEEWDLDLTQEEAYHDAMASRADAVETLFNDINRVYNEADNICSEAHHAGERLDFIICQWPEKIEEFNLRAVALEVTDWFLEYRVWAIERERQFKFQQSLEAAGEALPF